MDLPRSRAWLARAAVLALVVALLAPSAVSAATHTPIELRAGHIADPADGNTVIGVQGFKGRGQNSSKKPARVVAAGPNGSLAWLLGPSENISWYYDVDPLPNGDYLISGSHPSGATIIRYDPSSGERVWTERLDIHDTHDVDLINGDQLLVADMRGYNETTERNDAGLFVYNRTTEEVEYQWYARSIYSREQGGAYQGDWSHINDVDKVGDGEYLLSVRNMDEVILVNRSTDSVDWRLGSDGNHSILYEQHNPTYIESADGTPTVLVADSENDRVVEYEMVERGNGSGNSEWERTWTLGVNGSLNWPRDADRLPNGNTLVTDSLNHRVIEVTPDGEVVWEYYAPWGTYEAERTNLGDEPGGPTIADQNATGAYAVSGSAALTPGAAERATFAEWVRGAGAGTPLAAQADWFADRWAHITPWIRPVWMDPWAFVAAAGAGLVLLGWAGGELVYNRRTIRAKLAAALARVRGAFRDATGEADAEEADD
jgi:hypothetical protein